MSAGWKKELGASGRSFNSAIILTLLLLAFRSAQYGYAAVLVQRIQEIHRNNLTALSSALHLSWLLIANVSTLLVRILAIHRTL